MLVTPLRDGMNLIAKEFVASRVDEDGVLVLSEFAGAAAELDGAVIVNPYDVDGVAAAILQALAMPDGERRARMQALRRRVTTHDVHGWARGFLEQLAAARPITLTSRIPSWEPSVIAALPTRHASATLRLLVDYDGTLVPIARSPELAAPDDELLSLLDALARRPDIRLDIVSGRSRQTLDSWLGHLPVSLWAEHGFWHRPGHGQPWQAAASIPSDWMQRITPILEQFTASTPGSHVETKSASIAWHYRRAKREFGARQAHELRMLLGDALSNQPFEVLEGKKVIEVRLRGVSKALVAQRVQAEVAADGRLVAIGDDRTDEELFRALPASSVTVAVGNQPTSARHRVADYRAVRLVLRALLDDPPANAAERPITPAWQNLTAEIDRQLS
jgi:trehalose 6-phosphate synthase/phosphatase